MKFKSKELLSRLQIIAGTGDVLINYRRWYLISVIIFLVYVILYDEKIEKEVADRAEGIQSKYGRWLNNPARATLIARVGIIVGYFIISLVYFLIVALIGLSVRDLFAS